MWAEDGLWRSSSYLDLGSQQKGAGWRKGWIEAVLRADVGVQVFVP